MEKALGWLVNSPFRPALVLLAGFSGALTEDLHPADLVLGTEIANNTGETFRLDWPSQKSLFRQGRLLTWPKLVGDPEEKRRLGRDFAAVAVDMESATAARVCRQHQVPFGCLRAISDCLETPLSPRLVDLLQGGRVAPLRLARAFLTHPSLIGETWRLARDTRLAAQSLARGIAELLRGSSSEENG
jgi:adenosylhomocysteine nucleosidase